MSYIFRQFSRTLILFLFFTTFISAQNEIQLLEPEKPIARDMAGGESHSYHLRLTAGQFAHVITEQRGIDVVVKLFAPNGNKLHEIDSPNGTAGPEPIWFVTETAGDYRIEISSLEKNAKAARYEIKIGELRAANSDDKYYVDGRKLTAQAAMLLSERNEKNINQAAKQLEEALSHFRLINDKNRKAAAIQQIGRNYRFLNKFEDARKHFIEAAVLFKEANSNREAAIAFLDAGKISQNYSDALDSFKTAQTLTQIAGDKKLEIASFIEIGNTNYGAGDFTQAVESYQQAMKISREINLTERIAAIFDNLGSAYSAQYDFIKALESHQKSLTLTQELNLKNQIPGILLNIGNVYYSQGNFPQALDYFQRALTEFEKIRAPVGIAYATSNIGSVYLDSGEYDKALEYLLKAKEQKAKFLSKDVFSLLNIGLVYSYQGKNSEALDYFQKALNLAGELRDTKTEADVFGHIARFYLNRGERQKSLEFAEKAARLAEAYNYPIIFSNALRTIAESRLLEGQKNEAKQALESAIGKIESLRVKVVGGESETQNFFGNKTSPYLLMIDLLISENNLTEAFAYAERTKARALLDILQNSKTDIGKALSPEESGSEQNLKKEMAAFNARISKENDQNRISDLKKQLEKKRLEFEDFQTRLYAAHPELRVQRGEMKPISLEESAKLLPDDKSALLEYVVAEDKAFLFVLTKDAKQSDVSLKVYPIKVKKGDLAEKTQSFRTKLAKGDLDFSKQAQDLYNLLLKPAESQLKNKNFLIIVPDASLWDLPFQALQPIQNKYLIETSAVSYAPSLTALREMTRKNQGRLFSKPTLLAFGNPTVGKETSDRLKQVFMSDRLAPLPEAERLVNSLKQIYGSDKSKVFIGVEAREEIAKTEASKYRIIQFAAHGVLNNASPMYSHIVLSQKQDNPNEDGLLEAWEMKELDFNAEMVILSACETARGRVSAGEGVIGMSWALFIAGAPATVASQWKVESSSTTELMFEFHRQLLANKNTSKAEALRRASLKLLKSNQYKHPVFWAPFVIVGDGF